jgi:hypothetical protein
LLQYRVRKDISSKTHATAGCQFQPVQARNSRDASNSRSANNSSRNNINIAVANSSSDACDNIDASTVAPTMSMTLAIHDFLDSRGTNSENGEKCQKDKKTDKIVYIL